MKVSKILYLLIMLFLASCSTSSLFEDTNYPIADGEISVVIFCDNNEAKCEDYEFVIPAMYEAFGEDNAGAAMVYVDSEVGARMFEASNLSNIPSYLIFDKSGNEIYRSDSAPVIDEILNQIETSLQN